MSVELLDGTAIRDLVEDKHAFSRSFRDWLRTLPSENGDTVGTGSLEEFEAEIREMMLAVANGLGFLPVQIVLDEASFLRMAVERASGN